MAMSVVYTTINGHIVHENRGGVEAFYAPDTMGSTALLVSSTGTVTDTFAYWPYGEIVSHVGSSTTPFTFGGTIGYYLDIVSNQIYVRARYFRQSLARWQTVDPFWPSSPPFVYAKSSPVFFVDPSGAQQEPEPSLTNYIGWSEWQVCTFCGNVCKACVKPVLGLCKVIRTTASTLGHDLPTWFKWVKKPPSPWKPSQQCPGTLACGSMCSDLQQVIYPGPSFTADCWSCCGDSITFAGDPIAYRDAIIACKAACDALLGGRPNYPPPCQCPPAS